MVHAAREPFEGNPGPWFVAIYFVDAVDDGIAMQAGELAATAAAMDREVAVARGEAQDAVVAQALASFLGFSALDDAHALGGLPQDEADRVAVDEVRAVRRAARDAPA